MKTRIDFVTNSSSTSFLIKKVDKRHRTRTAKLSRNATKLRVMLNKMFSGKHFDSDIHTFDCVLNASLIEENGDKSLILEVHDNYESYIDMLDSFTELKNKGLFKFYEDDSDKNIKVIKLY